MASKTETAQQTIALIALLKALPTHQLCDVLTGLDASLNHPTAPEDGPRRRGSPA
ncbi:hypothetical protein [Nocardioides alcanivorans]|uniref:hypothetical protein n=1 Tax=Nocardioides alcanivorans TaxID=2897352 RepID=UPI001F428B73|nr:hypothetical protein [Nocardioides alcanivorans]